MNFLLLVLLAIAAYAQPTSPTTLSFRATQLGYNPYGQLITYDGTLDTGGTSTGTGTPYSCIIDTSVAGQVWVRVTGYITATATTSPGTYSACTGAKVRINSTDYPITTSLVISPNALSSIAYSKANPETAPSVCNGGFLSNPRYSNFDVSCLDPDRRPGGTFNMPAPGGTYTDPMGPVIRNLGADATYYPANSPFSRDGNILMANGGIWRLSDGVKVGTYPADNIASGNCWQELVSGWTNVMHCIEGNLPAFGGQGRIMRYTFPNWDTCGTLPCTIGSGVEIYRATGTGIGVVDNMGMPANYNFVTKGGTSGATKDGWQVWSELRLNSASYDKTGDWKLCIANILVPAGTVTPVCTNNVETNFGPSEADYLQMSSVDSDGRRRIIIATASPQQASVWSWAPGEATIRYDGYGPRRTDITSDTKMRPYWVSGDNSGWYFGTPHASIVQVAGRTCILGDGSPNSAGAEINILLFCIAAQGPGATVSKDSYTWSELGGGAGIGSFMGAYVGCALFSPICLGSNYAGYGALSGKSFQQWVSPTTCTGGSCTVTTGSAHGMSSGTVILIGRNNYGIALGTKATVTVTGTTTYTLTAAGASGTNQEAIVIVDEFLGGSNRNYDGMMLTRFFSWGRQYVSFAPTKGISFDGYSDLTKPAISSCGDKIAWGTNNGIPFASYLLAAETGLGCPQRDEQLDGPSTTVSAIPGAGSLTLRFIVPANATSCTAQASTTPDLASAVTGNANSGAWREIVLSGLSSTTPYYWRVACQRAPSGLVPGGINEARGVAVTR